MTNEEHEIISEALYGIQVMALGEPSGDPPAYCFRIAALVYETLKKLEMDYEDEDLKEELQGNNIYEFDFLKELENAKK